MSTDTTPGQWEPGVSPEARARHQARAARLLGEELPRIALEDDDDEPFVSSAARDAVHDIVEGHR